MTDAVRRSVSIPIVSNGKNVLALAEIGAKLWSKDYVYRMFFEKACDKVEEMLLEEIIRRGGTEADYKSMLNKAVDKLSVQGLTVSNVPAVNKGKNKDSVDNKGVGKKAIIVSPKKKKLVLN